MVDKYYNFEELRLNQVYGQDYLVSSILRPPSRVSSIAIHGGGIEIGTTEIAREVAGLNSHNFYTFEGLLTEGNTDLHITSTRFDEPQALNVQDNSDYTLSWHGASGDIAKTLMGGRDTTKRNQISAALNAAGFVTEIASQELNGNSTGNICNKNGTKAGVQLEITTEQRRRFFVNRDWNRSSRLTRQFTDEFYNYVQAVASVSALWDSGSQGTPNYRLNIATPSNLMSDFDRWINSNFTKLESVPAAINVTAATLPVSGTFELGSRIFHVPTQSIYILICKDPDWGWHWRPVQKAMGQWTNVPTTALEIPADWDLAPFAARPLQIALDNMGMAHWRGVIRYNLAPSITKNTSYHPFKVQPFGFRPRETDFFNIGYQSFDIGTNDWEGVRLYIPDDEDEPISIRAQGGSTTAPTGLNMFYINGGVQYALGAGHYVIP